MRRMLLAVVIVAGLAGCCCPTKEDKTLISTAAAVGQNNLAKWDALTDAQRKTAQRNLVGAVCAFDFTVNGTALPAEFAPVTSGK